MSENFPKWLNALELNHNINDIYIREPYAYLATSGNTKDLIIVDISNPQFPAVISSLDIPGSEDVLSLYALGYTLFIGRKKSLHNNEPAFVIVDISNPQNPIILSGLDIKNDIESIISLGTTTILAENGITPKMEIVDTTNLLNPKITSSNQLTTTPIQLENNNNTIYILQQ
jgi:hypothetical protein